MAWLKITCAVSEDQLELVSEKMERAGAQAVTIEDAGDHPLFDLHDGEMPIWEVSMVSGLFAAEQGSDPVIAAIKASFSPAEMPDYRVMEIPEEDWERSWMDRFQPMQYGDKLWVVPTWCEPPDPGATNIMLDPGMAFGSGSHETTRMCLNWLANRDISNKTVIDYGCGSGVLAIAALKMGAQQAIGVDIDPQALKASRQNAEANAVSERLQLVLPEQLPDEARADIVFANILAGTLLDLKEKLLSLRKPGGVLLLSGLLKSQQDSISEAYNDGGVVDSREDGDWVMMAVQAAIPGS
jgi:ribosomal protein L11 methyltransferase